MQAKDTIRHALAIGTILILTQVASAQPSDPECRASGGATICVRFDNLANKPVETIDFDFDFTDPDRPVVTLLRGSDGSTTRNWRVWSHDGAGNADHIGGISATGAYNYFVKVLDASNGDGAVDLGTTNLNPTGNFWSNLNECRITGNVTGNVFVEQFNDTFGHLDIEMDGDLANGADLTFWSGGDIVIHGNVASAGSLISGTFLGDGKDIKIDGYSRGDIDISDYIKGSEILIKKNVYDTVSISVADMRSGLVLDSKMVFNETSGNFEGDIVLGNGIPVDQQVDIKGALTSTGSIDLGADAVAGDLFVRKAGAGVITNGGSVTGQVILAGATDPTFSGTATFTTVGSGGLVGVDTLSGDIDITGASGVVGSIIVDADITSTGDINITGTLTGTIHAKSDVIGTIWVGGDASTGDVLVDGELSGDIDLDDDCGVVTVSGGLVGVGRVLVDGQAQGGITLGKSICPSALVRVVGGLASTGFIDMDPDTTNCSGFGDGGDIQIGNGGNIIFDPSAYILISDGESPPGGDWTGAIKVVGNFTADPGDELEICVCGTMFGTITITQPSADPEFPTPSAACSNHCN